MKLRDYQTQLIKDIYTQFKSGAKRVLASCPTGGGKSLCLAHIVKDAIARKRRVLIIVHRKKLVSQLKGTIQAYTGHKSAVIAPKYKPDYDNLVQIAMAQTLDRRELPKDIRVICVDECHIVSHFDVVKRCLDEYSPNGIWALSEAYLIGFTATPWRTNKKEGFCTMFERSVKAPSPRWMIQNGYLTNPRLFSYQCLDTTQLEVDGSGDYTVSSLSRVCNDEYNEDVVTKWQDLCLEKKTIVFCASVKQAKSLNAIFGDRGFKSELITGSTSDKVREEIFARFKTGETQILTTVSTCTEGFDETSIEAVVIARPTRSPALLIQMIGRGIRLHPGKNEVFIIDCGECIDWLQSTKICGKEVDDPIDLSHFSLCPSYKPKAKVEEKKCEACGEMIPIFAKICPSCGFDIPPKKKEKPNLVEFPELEEIFTKQGKNQFKFLRFEIVNLFENKSNLMSIFTDFHGKFGFLPPHDWFLGALFNFKEPELSERAYRLALKENNKVDNDCIDFLVDLEFGKLGRKYKLPGGEPYTRSAISQEVFDSYSYLGVKERNEKSIKAAYRAKVTQTKNSRLVNLTLKLCLENI
ncbi:DEAD/DEAH box helicase [Myxosarcina sp. GI1(2024)]